MDILLISDQPLTVLALRAVLARHQPVAQVVDASHVAEAMTMLSGPHDFRAIVLDLDTHGVRAVSTTALLREMWPNLPLALLSTGEGDAGLVRSIGLGVGAYLLKGADAATLRQSFRQLLAGDVRTPAFCLQG